jgi:O-antigen/teichoic acid export membrane protein
VVEVVRRRLLHGFGANALGSVVTTLIQLVAVPILIQSWGARLYGEWLVLLAIPTFFTMADWGFENVAGNEMILAGKEREKGVEVYKTLQLFIALASIALVLIVAAATQLFPVARWLVPGGLDQRHVTIILVALTVHVAVVLQGGIIRAAFRSTGNYALGVMYQNFTRIGDAAAVNITALMGGGLVAAALAMLTSRIVITGIAYVQMRRRIRGSMSRRRARTCKLSAGSLRP